MRGPNGRTNGNGSGSYASAKQLNYLRALANEHQLGALCKQSRPHFSIT